MNSPSDITGPINIGNPFEIPVLELAERIIALTGSSSRIEFRPLPTDDPLLRRPDISQAVSVLGWQPTVDLETGLTRTIAYFRGTIKSEIFKADAQILASAVG
jgi:UDP-glucuronate decarboxylase